VARIPGFTSTGSKRPEALFGAAAGTTGVPSRMVRSYGCRVVDESGREYVDYVMGLGAVALGYGHPGVTRAVQAAAADGAVGPLPPVLEEEVAETLCHLVPAMEQVRFLKTGAEAMAAAVRLARAHTGRDLVLGCGYHGWLDWCQPTGAPGVPPAVSGLYAELPFNDAERTRTMIRAAGDRLAAVIAEPVIMAPPSRDWLAVLRDESHRAGAVLVLDEVKTVGRVAVGGAAERWGIDADLVVVGKAIANGFPLAAVGGSRAVMAAASRAWISSTLATEFVSLAAARATLDLLVRERVPEHLERVGSRLLQGLARLADRYPERVPGVAGLPSMCMLRFADDDVSSAVAAGCAARGVLFKRAAYDFVSLAHDETVVDQTLDILDDVLSALR